MEKKIIIWGVVFALLSVILGAFGAHGLQKLVDANAVASFTTGVRYQMYHAMALLIVAQLSFINHKVKKIVSLFFIVGTFLFSFSIYLLTLDDLWPVSFTKIAWVTPLGGLLLIVGWSYLLLTLFQKN